MKRLFFLFLIFVLLGGSAYAQIFKSEAARKAQELLVKGDIEGSTAVLNKAIDDHKDLLEAYKMRGNLNAKIGNLTGAIADYTSVLEIDPTDARIYERRALYRGFRRDSAGALKDYDAAIAYGRRTEQIYCARANIKHDIGDIKGAIADFQTALAFNPDWAQAYVGWSQLLELNSDINAAIVLLQDFLDRYESKNNGKLPVASETVTDSINIKRRGKEQDGSQVYLTRTETSFRLDSLSVEDIDRKEAELTQIGGLSFAYFTLGRFYTEKGELDRAVM